MRRLIVNADDFGFTRDVNAGIVEAYQRGILSATTVMANGEAFEDAVRLASENAGLDVGCHLVLIGGKSVAEPGRPLPRSSAEFMRRLALGWSAQAIEEEFAAQIESVRAAGLRPSHLDTHKHTHLAPRVLDAALRVGRRYGIAWIRRPFDLPMSAAEGRAPWARRVLQRGLRLLEPLFQRKLARAGLRATDWFAGFQLTGGYGPSDLAALIRSLPEGVTEFMCHPGRCGAELRRAPTRLKESRAEELRALTSQEARQAIEEAGIARTDFRSLAQEPAPQMLAPLE